VTRQYAKRQRTFFRHQLSDFALREEVGEKLADLARELAAWLKGADSTSY